MFYRRLLLGILSFVIGCAIVVGIISNLTKQKSKESKEKVELTISAAASLKDSLIEIQSEYEKKHSNVKLRYNFGSSGALQQQIDNGAPVDLFISAGKDKMDLLVRNKVISKEEFHDLLENELVLIVPSSTDSIVQKFEDLKKQEVKKISIGIPETVPAGQYAKETLETMKIWSSVEQKIVFAKDVRQVLNYVETGNIDAGVVYKTDALTSKKIKVVETANEQTHQPIIYPVGIINNSKNHAEIKKFYLYLQSKKSGQIFEKNGFKSK